jgi:hypothetical protein
MRHFLLSLGDIFVITRLGPAVRAVARGVDTLGYKIAKLDYMESCES